ncbi:MAG: hypothetical protein CVV64_19950 [Candidatus Wallbacteria bacterium HGW-Wallbacteria-1]|uniref:ABC transporter substrate-binding protein n=1 Tax=Candidatus Wallbacteria bacterium HGW-Wallbacteria-1 TaxID=2013854 RepID=A0A2N1PIN7_9BACT|nr:MAG: hypothetical protein CVV64_19950 [Candidatus Wallbacteria bacterium HGW-Wallbacteria-1]
MGGCDNSRADFSDNSKISSGFDNIPVAEIHRVIIESLPDEMRSCPGSPPLKPWRIACFQGGEYFDYSRQLRELVGGLVALGWIQGISYSEIESSPDDVHGFWKWLSQINTGPWLSFPSDCFFSAEWVTRDRGPVADKIVSLIETGRGPDLIIALGTWAGQDLPPRISVVPIMVIAATDPVASGILKPDGSCPQGNLHVTYDPEKYVRQIRAFHNIVQFKSIGVAHDFTETGKSYANLRDLKKLGMELGFEVLNASCSENNIDLRTCAENVRAAYRELAAAGVQAVWVNSHRGEDAGFMPWILEPLLEAGIPTWSHHGPAHVSKGVLFSIGRRDSAETGIFNARVAAEILLGSKPSEINMIHNPSPSLVINMGTAEKIGFKVPHSLIQAADQVFPFPEEKGKEIFSLERSRGVLISGEATAKDSE